MTQLIRWQLRKKNEPIHPCIWLHEAYRARTTLIPRSLASSKTHPQTSASSLVGSPSFVSQALLLTLALSVWPCEHTLCMCSPYPFSTLAAIEWVSQPREMVEWDRDCKCFIFMHTETGLNPVACHYNYVVSTTNTIFSGSSSTHQEEHTKCLHSKLMGTRPIRAQNLDFVLLFRETIIRNGPKKKRWL